MPALQHTLRPVNRLPSEAISRITRCLLDEDSTDSRSIIPLTHVCRFWRKVITSTPGNWTSISNKRVGLAKLSLERTRAAPLKVWLDMPLIKGNPEFYDHLAPHAKNMKSLTVDSVLHAGQLVQMLHNFPESMPRLRSLTLSGDANSVDPFGSFAPDLTYLSLTTIPLYPSFRRLRTLTVLTLRNHRFDLHITALLDFLEENRSLERVTLEIDFTHVLLRAFPLRRVVIIERLRYLSIRCNDAMDSRALISNIALPRGAYLEIACCDPDTGLNNVLIGIPAVHLPNLLSSTYMEYECWSRSIRLFGPNGGFSFENSLGLAAPFVEFLLLPTIDVQELHLRHRRAREGFQPHIPLVFPPLFFPSLKVLAVDGEVSNLFSALFANPSYPPSLEAITFLDCDLTDGFVQKLAWFAFSRKKTTSVSLHCIVIINSKGSFPSAMVIATLRKHVPIVHAQVGNKLVTR